MSRWHKLKGDTGLVLCLSESFSCFWLFWTNLYWYILDVVQWRQVFQNTVLVCIMISLYNDQCLHKTVFPWLVLSGWLQTSYDVMCIVMWLQCIFQGHLHRALGDYYMQGHLHNIWGSCSMYFKDMCMVVWVTAVCILRTCALHFGWLQYVF